MKNTTSKTLLVPVDFNDQAYIALEQACHVAKLMDLSVTILYVVEETGMFSHMFSEAQNESMKATINEKLDKLAKEFSTTENVEIFPMIAKGRIYSKIVETAEMVNARFIVMGTSSVKESDKNITGANTSRVIRYAKCPVITINGKHHYTGCRNILVPLDLSKETRQKVNRAIELAKVFKSNISIMSALLSEEDYVINKLAGQIKQVKKYIEERGIECSAEIYKAPKKEKTLAQAILSYAKKRKDIDLIMIMTQQETNWVEFFVGSTATDIIRNTEIPVLSIIPTEDDGTIPIIGY